MSSTCSLTNVVVEDDRGSIISDFFHTLDLFTPLLKIIK